MTSSSSDSRNKGVNPLNSLSLTVCVSASKQFKLEVEPLSSTSNGVGKRQIVQAVFSLPLTYESWQVAKMVASS